MLEENAGHGKGCVWGVCASRVWLMGWQGPDTCVCGCVRACILLHGFVDAGKALSLRMCAPDLCSVS